MDSELPLAVRDAALYQQLHTDEANRLAAGEWLSVRRADALAPIGGFVAELVEEGGRVGGRSEEHTSELQSLRHLVCRLLLEKKKKLTQQLDCTEIRLHSILVHRYGSVSSS